MEVKVRGNNGGTTRQISSIKKTGALNDERKRKGRTYSPTGTDRIDRSRYSEVSIIESAMATTVNVDGTVL